MEDSFCTWCWRPAHAVAVKLAVANISVILAHFAVYTCKLLSLFSLTFSAPPLSFCGLLSISKDRQFLLSNSGPTPMATLAKEEGRGGKRKDRIPERLHWTSPMSFKKNNLLSFIKLWQSWPKNVRCSPGHSLVHQMVCPCLRKDVRSGHDR